MTFQIELRIDDDPRPVSHKLVMAGWNGEMGWHLALKLLGFLLFFEDNPQIETGIGWHYKPDLVALDARGEVRLWVDCGNIAVRKIDRVATKVGRDGRFFILKRHMSETRIFLRSLQGKVRRKERLTVIAFDDGFVDELTTRLDGTNHLTAKRRPDGLHLELGNRHGRHQLSSRIHRFRLD